ncbi:hypothetical protein [uncultured Pseudoteredinibacter sp.]|uniref:hypothetical protein n=1 Tax=uncultured Pseudoteredinibacter sp. TaxID=1641701 RepID=UPI002635D598|nr:hypothetical protein [uncultured Pseudoteredinibacter sp.]
MDYQDATVFEYVEFRCDSKFSQQQIFDALDATIDILNETEGFVHRDIAKRDDIWVELVYWQDQDSANRGLEKFSSDPRNQTLLAMIDQDSLSIYYSQLQKSR